MTNLRLRRRFGLWRLDRKQRRTLALLILWMAVSATLSIAIVH